jgi:hypothetical protein
MGDSQIQMNAFTILERLVLNHEANQSAAGSSGAIADVLQLMKASDVQLQKLAVRTLHCLVINHEANQSAAGSSGAIADVLQLMKASDVGLQSEAVQTLEYLVNNHEANQSAAEFEKENFKVSRIEIANDEEDVRAYAKVF